MSKIQLSNKKEIKTSLNKSLNKIMKNLSKNDKEILYKIENNKLPDTKQENTTKKGNYTRKRLKIHKKIIDKTLKKDKKTKTPDLYIFGGVGGSGKTGLNKFVKEKALTINNDDIKKDLSKYSKSPSKKYKLLHAGLLHREAKDIENKIIKKVLKTKKDVILDRTLSDYKKNKELAKEFKKKKYKIHTLGTNLKPHLAIKRSTNRFLKGKDGRYVPVSKIGEIGNKINRNVLKFAKLKFNKSSVVIKTQKRKPSLIYSKNINKINLKKSLNKIAYSNGVRRTKQHVRKYIKKPIKKNETRRRNKPIKKRNRRK